MNGTLEKSLPEKQQPEAEKVWEGEGLIKAETWKVMAWTGGDLEKRRPEKAEARKSV